MLKASFSVFFFLFNILMHVGHVIKYGIIQNFMSKFLLGDLLVFVGVSFSYFLYLLKIIWSSYNSGRNI